MSRTSYIDYYRYDVRRLRRTLEDFIYEFNNKDPIFECSCGREHLIPQITIDVDVNDLSDDEVIEEYVRLESLGLIR